MGLSMGWVLYVDTYCHLQFYQEKRNCRSTCRYFTLSCHFLENSYYICLLVCQSAGVLRITRPVGSCNKTVTLSIDRHPFKTGLIRTWNHALTIAYSLLNAPTSIGLQIGRDMPSDTYCHLKQERSIRLLYPMWYHTLYNSLLHVPVPCQPVSTPIIATYNIIVELSIVTTNFIDPNCKAYRPLHNSQI